MAEGVALEVHVPEADAVRDGVAEGAVEEVDALEEVRRAAAPVGVRLELFEVRHVVALVHEELAVQGRAREVAAHRAVLAGGTAVVGVEGREHVEMGRAVGLGDGAVVALDGPALVLRVAVEGEGGEGALRDVLDDAGEVVEGFHRGGVHAGEVVGHAAVPCGVAPDAVHVEPEARRHGGHGGRLERDGLVPPGRAQTGDVAVAGSQKRPEAGGHGRGGVGEAGLLQGRAADLRKGVPREVLAPGSFRDVDTQQVPSVAAVEEVDGGAVGVAARAAERLARVGDARDRAVGALGIRREDIRVRVDDALPGMLRRPPVGGRVEEARQQRRLRREGPHPVEDLRLVGHAAEALLQPVGVGIVAETAERREEVDARAGHCAHVLVQQLPLPEENGRDGLPVAVEAGRTVQLRDAPARGGREAVRGGRAGARSAQGGYGEQSGRPPGEDVSVHGLQYIKKGRRGVLSCGAFTRRAAFPYRPDPQKGSGYGIISKSRRGVIE